MTDQEINLPAKEMFGKLRKPTTAFGGGPKKRLDLLKKYINFKDQKLLDIGCGQGLYSNEFRNEGAIVFGIDIDEQKIEKAKKLFQGINFEKSAAEKTPFVLERP